MKEFCKIFTVEDEQILVRKGVQMSDGGKEIPMIFINSFMLNSIGTSVFTIEAPIVCCCLSCQDKNFKNFDQSHAESILKAAKQRRNGTYSFYPPHTQN